MSSSQGDVLLQLSDGASVAVSLFAGSTVSSKEHGPFSSEQGWGLLALEGRTWLNLGQVTRCPAP